MNNLKNQSTVYLFVHSEKVEQDVSFLREKSLQVKQVEIIQFYMVIKLTDN